MKKKYIVTGLLFLLMVGSMPAHQIKNLDKLNALVKQGETLMTESSHQYAPNAVAELKDIIFAVKLSIENENVEQTVFDQLEAKLSAALTKTVDSQGYMPKVATKNSGLHGFIHPGGIVSQADIDHARQMIAANDPAVMASWNRLCSNEYAQATVKTWPTETVIRGGKSGQNYMNCARGAAMAFQNALRWKIGGTKENADAAVRIMMSWAKNCKAIGGDSNMSLAAGIYGHEFANAAELMRDYERWAPEDFKLFKQWMVKVFYNKSIDFLRRRHDTWKNARYAHAGERPGHYWSNWGLCNALCVMSVGILCDDVHMYNQGVSFYKYDHVGTFRDRSKDEQIVNDGCNEFIGNLVPLTTPDSRSPIFGLGQMQESGRDQGHALMALSLASDICQVGFNQGDDLFAYMGDRIAAGAEFVAACNFSEEDISTLPYKTYNYADCRATMGKGWGQTKVSTGGKGEKRPMWDRLLGYYEGLRGVRLQYAEKAREVVGADGGGGNYSQNSGGFDALGFTTLTHYRPLVSPDKAIMPLSGDIVYKGETLKNQANLGGLGYKYEVVPTKAIPADGETITLIPQLPEGAEDCGQWKWDTGEATRSITVKADHSYIYRVAYTAPNGAVSRQAFAIAVAGDADADGMTPHVTVNGVTTDTCEVTVLKGTEVVLSVSADTGWSNDWLWDNGTRGTNRITIDCLTSPRTYTCQYVNQSGAVDACTFKLNIRDAEQAITIDGSERKGNRANVLSGTKVSLRLVVPAWVLPDEIIWQDGSRGYTHAVGKVVEEKTYTATYGGKEYQFTIGLKDNAYTYYKLLRAEKGYSPVSSEEQLAALAPVSYFVLASDESDLLVGLAAGKHNGNKAMYFQSPVDPEDSYDRLWSLEPFEEGYSFRNKGYDGLLLQTENNAAWNMRTHDQPKVCSWTKMLIKRSGDAWVVENGKYKNHWLGLWDTANGYKDGEELACNKTGENVAHYQLFAIPKLTLHSRLADGASVASPKDLTSAIINPAFDCGTIAGWTVTGTWGSQKSTMLESWHSKGGFKIEQKITELPNGKYAVSVQLVNGDGPNTACLYAATPSGTGKTMVETSCAGLDYKTVRDKMAADGSYGRITVEVIVSDHTLTVGLDEPTNEKTWLCFDNFHLAYLGEVATTVEKVESQNMSKTSGIYDLQGRRLLQKPTTRGIYIRNGKKIAI